VAAEFPQLCEAETEAFGRLLGTPVQRLATISRGDGICTTHVTCTSGSESGGRESGGRELDSRESDGGELGSREPESTNPKSSNSKSSNSERTNENTDKSVRAASDTADRGNTDTTESGGLSI
jgi:hypothetical protein